MIEEYEELEEPDKETLYDQKNEFDLDAVFAESNQPAEVVDGRNKV